MKKAPTWKVKVYYDRGPGDPWHLVTFDDVQALLGLAVFHRTEKAPKPTGFFFERA